MQNPVGQQNITQCHCTPQNPAQQYQAPYQTVPQQPAQYSMQQPMGQQMPQAMGQQMEQAAPQPMAQPMQQAMPQQMPQAQNQNVQVPNYSGVNIQIFNPSVTPPGATAPVYNVNAPNYSTNPAPGCYPPNYYTGGTGQGRPVDSNTGTESTTNTTNTTTTENKTTDKKTEKREIVQLTDDYIRTLENYLNSQDKEVRLMGAKEVIARLDEDHSRKDDKALNALVNKMLQDPSTSVRALALTALNLRIVTGDNFTVNLLQQMQNSQSGYGQDALQATNALLKMAGQTVEKEFEVKNNTKTTESKK